LGSRGSIDARSRWRDSLERSQKRRIAASRRRRRVFRLRGAAFSFAAVALLVTAVGTAVSVADDPALKAGAASADVILRKGDRGRAVKAVQRKLGITADGVFGPQTHRAVKGFQRRRHLTADGIVGPETRHELKLRPFSHSSVVHPRRKKRRGSDSGGGLANLPAALVRIAECESGGDPEAVSPSGRYRGKYQFMRSTWKTWGGRGDDPAEASEVHQDRVALRLYRARGTEPWPSCGA
jgi:hypothetical protein